MAVSMLHIPLNATVECTDGPVGTSSAIIVDPETLRVTHFVVREGQRPHTQRLVLVGHAQAATADTIHVDCTREELGKMAEFVVHTYREVEVPRYSGAESIPSYTPELERLPVDREQIPEGEVAIRAGMAVHATDGKVGQVDELLQDPASGQITHFVMRQDHVWGDKDVVMPVSAVKYADRQGLHLKVDKQTVASMLAVPVKGVPDITDVELVIVTFPETGQAEEALEKVATKDAVRFLNAAVLVKDEGGETSLREVQDVSKRHGAVFGALTGGVMGMIAGPGGGIVGAVAGAVTGRAAAKRIDMGFPDDYLQKLEQGLQPGSSALVVLIERQHVARLEQALAGFEGQFLQQALTEDIVARLTTASET